VSPEFISRAKVKAEQASPLVIPLRVDGSDHYVMFMHPRQLFDLKQNSVYAQAQREAGVRGEQNKIFTGAAGIWDDVILHSHPYCPYLDIDVALNNFSDDDAGTDYAAVDAYRAMLCGRQAVVYAECQSDEGWVEETFDYGNKHGFCTVILGGIQKVTLNTKDYGVISMDSAATAV
jgi:N4-gp56 family major capsid protein